MLLIQLGDRGDAVADVQRRLSAMGYAVGPSGVDGVFADETRKAVASFQQRRGLPESGVVDERTWRSLVEASLKLGDRLLYLRSPFFRGDDVSELQERLNTLGFNCGEADGVFGRMTERAVRDFQKNTGLPGDGIAGEATLGAMEKLKNILATKSATSLPRKKPKPFSSTAAFKERRVTISATTSEAAVASSACVDLAERLKNLLELLGARVCLVHAQDEAAPGGADVVVTFAMADGATGEKGFSVEAVGDASAEVAGAVYEQLSSTVTETADLGMAVRGGESGAASIVVRPGVETSERDAELLADEAFAQKVAVAVFDGLHSYFRLARGDQ